MPTVPGNLWRGAMLRLLPEYIRDCRERAAECREIANGVIDENLKKQYLDIEHRWTHLVKSYVFVESLERFLLDAERTKAAMPKSPVSDD